MTLVLVDGSNVARCRAWRARHSSGADDVELRRRLVDATCSWAATADHEVRVAFDGAGPYRPGAITVTEQVEVIGSGGDEGDDVVQRLASEARRSRTPYWVVTSDRALRMVAGGGADRVIGADDFVAEVVRDVGGGAVSASQPGAGGTARTAHAGDQGGTSRLADDLDDDVRAKLERMRRGLDP